MIQSVLMSNELSQVIAEVIRRRSSGERIPDSSIMEKHAQLMPELGKQLRALRRVEEAESTAAQAEADGKNTMLAGAAKIDRSADSSRADSSRADSSRADSIPGHELIEEIHRGGQGVVYRAVQQTTGRQVAIKIMREGPFVGPRDRARFEREVRVLAHIQHPRIVAIRDSGVSAGLHYFVMDYIPGQPLDSYLSSQKKTVQELLDLFIKICEAVHAAHLRGVIHRDLKPSNIQVDKQGEPHILDFGLAKIGTDDIHEESQWRQMTMTGQFVGSVPWASPEQADGPPDRIDLRTDVYSLGVVLFFMLTGRFPYSVVGRMQDVLRNITQSEPAKPSSMRKNVPSDVDTIVLKCLAKEPQRRYQSAAALLEDVERFLSNQPIIARAPSTIYQLKKLVARNKLPAVLFSTLLVMLLVFAIWMSALYSQAAGAHNRAVVAEKIAEQRRKEAERETATARAINEFLINDMLASAEPENARGQTVTVAEVLRNASNKVDSAFSGQPLIEASVRIAIAESYFSLGMYVEAEAHLRSAIDFREQELGDRAYDTLAVRLKLIETLRRQEKPGDCKLLAEETYNITRDILDKGDPLALRAAEHFGWVLWRQMRLERGLQLFEETLDTATRIYGEDHAIVVDLVNSWARWPHYVDDVIKNEALYRRALGLSRRLFGDDHPQTLAAMTNLGMSLAMQRRFEEGEELQRTALDLRRRILGDHPETIESLIQLTSLLREATRLDEAEAVLHEAIDMCIRILEENHFTIIEARHALANTLMRQCRWIESIKLSNELLELATTRNFGHNLFTAGLYDHVGLILLRLEYYAEAEQHFRTCLDTMTAVGGIQRHTVGTLKRFVLSLAQQDKIDEARPHAKELLELRRRAANYPEADAYVLNCYARALITVPVPDLRDPELGLEIALQASEQCTDSYHYNRYTIALGYEANGDLDRAIEFLYRALAQVPVEDSEDRRYYEEALVRIYEQLGDPGAAEEVYRDILELRREAFPHDHPDIAQSLHLLGRTLLLHGKLIVAEDAAREAAEILRAAYPQGHWRIAQAMSLQGASLSEQNRYEEAEPLLLDAFDQLKAIEYAPRQTIRETAERIVDLYDSWSRGDQANPYRVTTSAEKRGQ